MSAPPPPPTGTEELPLTRASVLSAHALIKPYIVRTPSLPAPHLSSLGSTPALPLSIHLKLESLQRTHSFKLRGVTHSLLRLPAGTTSTITHSSGNHGAALALASSRTGRRATVVMPTTSSALKVAAVREHGGDVVWSGPSPQERRARLDEVVAACGAAPPAFVPPYDAANTILGQGTAAAELLDDVPGLDVVVAPCGGGGLLAGTALAAEGSGAAVVGVEPQAGGTDDCARGLRWGQRIAVIEDGPRTIADGLRTTVGVRNWEIISDRSKVRGVTSVSEEQIKRALRETVLGEKLLVEPSSAVPVAGVLWGDELRTWLAEIRREKGKAEGEPLKVGIIVSGGNVAVETLVGILAEKDE